MTTAIESTTLRLGLPKGSMCDCVFALLDDAGIGVHVGGRQYRPALSLAGIEAKLLKPQNIVEMLHAGSRDIGFAGADWVDELGADLVELLDTGLDPVRLIAAAPRSLIDGGSLPLRPLVVASEYLRLARTWIGRRGCGDTLVRSYGATEVFPPEDADVVIDNTATGSTLAANDLVVVEELGRSSTRLYANPTVLDDPLRRDAIERLVLLLRSVLDARHRVMVEVNVRGDCLDRVLEVLPCMREPTVAPLGHDAGFAVKAAVPRDGLTALIPLIKSCGGADIVVSTFTQIVA